MLIMLHDKRKKLIILVMIWVWDRKTDNKKIVLTMKQYISTTLDTFFDSLVQRCTKNLIIPMKL